MIEVNDPEVTGVIKDPGPLKLDDTDPRDGELDTMAELNDSEVEIDGIAKPVELETTLEVTEVTVPEITRESGESDDES